MPSPPLRAIATFEDCERPAGLCLLVVDDDKGDSYLIGRALMDHPAVGQVVHAADGVEALDLVQRCGVKPDLAFIDLHMPRKSGFELLADLASRPQPRFPMVVLTSSSLQTDAMRGRLAGAIRVIAKPDTLKQLGKVLTRAIEAACPRSAAIERARRTLPPALDDVGR